MPKVRIVTDSTADLPRELVQQYGITVVPLKVFFGSECFVDGVDLSAAEFFSRLAASRELPTTSQPSPTEFVEYYRPLIDEGADIVSIHISAQMSGTLQSAQLARTMLNYDGLEVIDSRTVSVVLGMVVLAAARAAQAGRSRAEVVALVQDIIANHRVYFMVDTLEYLQRGGRIGKAQAFLGTILNVKPLCTIVDGVIHPYEKVRGRKKAINRLVQLMAEQCQDSGPLYCFMTHGNDPGGLKSLQDLVREKLNCPEMAYSQMGAVVGTHVGPGVVGLAVCPYKYLQW
ncbi:DegV family protein [Desulfallas thermosapovorans]|uniref:DegV family protein with EDD domain n=1 Tax=Desulfallas thermosapovorans DSM 6562 TaxID=1121431 RepID=A0A5S4ZWD7_9FIRM|nr:DegV family protein [Desulfallas thermosapovorans]TYO97192.1 DegV family protein with EDD domain [Desulfallas thermosapovorans DSM 6562]